MRVLVILFSLTILSINAQETNCLGGENWNISNGVLQLKGSPKDTIAKKYWKFLENLLPSEKLNKYVYSLRLFTDGPQEELGGISPLNNLNSKWEIDIDTLDFSFHNKNKPYITDYLHTTIHEFGHLLTLNSEQIELTEDDYQNNKKGYLTTEGYAKNNSYLAKFVDRFWHTQLLKEWDKIDKIKNEDRKIKNLYTFYLKNEDHFLSDYAAESPEEDIAESWTFFVLNEKPILKKIMHQKALFFYKFPELITYRQNIRDKITLIPVNYINNYKINLNNKVYIQNP